MAPTPIPPWPKVTKQKPGWRPQAINSGNPLIDNQDAGIQLTYDLLGSALKQGSSVQKGNFHKATEAVRNAYDSGMGTMKSANSSLLDFLTSQSHELGLDESTASSVAGVHTQNAKDMMDMAKMRTSELSGLVGQGAQYYNAARMQVSGAAREEAQQRVTARTDLQKILTDFQAEQERARAEVEIARINAQTAKMEANAAAAARRSGGGGGSGSLDPLDELKAMLLGQEFESEEDKQAFFQEHGYYPGTGPPSAGKSGTGQTGIEGFLNNPQAGYWGQQAGPKFRNALNTLVRGATLHPAGNPNSKSGQSLTPYETARRRVYKAPVARNMSKQALLTALRLRMGG